MILHLNRTRTFFYKSFFFTSNIQVKLLLLFFAYQFFLLMLWLGVCILKRGAISKYENFKFYDYQL